MGVPTEQEDFSDRFASGNSEESYYIKEISENIYVTRKKKKLREDDVMTCFCPYPGQGNPGCTTDCMNRSLYVECIAIFAEGDCPAGDACTNNAFQKKRWAKLRFQPAGKKGYGLFAMEDIAAGEMVIEYCGEVMDEKTFRERKENYLANGIRHSYFMALNATEYIDACEKGNLARFTNHSCEPNMETQKWTVGGELRIGFFAKRSIKAEDECTIDYKFRHDGERRRKCYCGSALCCGILGGGQGDDELIDESDDDDVIVEKEPVFTTGRIKTMNTTIGRSRKDDGESKAEKKEKKKKAAKASAKSKGKDEKSTVMARGRQRTIIREGEFEIQDTIDSLINEFGGLQRKGDVMQVLRLFNTVFSNQYNKNDIYGDASQGYSKNLENNPRELSILLECFTHTTIQAVLKIIAEKGMVMFQRCLEFTSANLPLHLPCLRKTLKVIHRLPLTHEIFERTRLGRQPLQVIMIKIAVFTKDSQCQMTAKDIMEKFYPEELKKKIQEKRERQQANWQSHIRKMDSTNSSTSNNLYVQPYQFVNDNSKKRPAKPHDQLPLLGTRDEPLDKSRASADENDNGPRALEKKQKIDNDQDELKRKEADIVGDGEDRTYLSTGRKKKSSRWDVSDPTEFQNAEEATDRQPKNKEKERKEPDAEDAKDANQDEESIQDGDTKEQVEDHGDDGQSSDGATFENAEGEKFREALTETIWKRLKRYIIDTDDSLHVNRKEGLKIRERLVEAITNSERKAFGEAQRKGIERKLTLHHLKKKVYPYIKTHLASIKKKKESLRNE